MKKALKTVGLSVFTVLFLFHYNIPKEIDIGKRSIGGTLVDLPIFLDN